MKSPSGAGLRSCAFLTMGDLGDFVVDDELVQAPLEALGWRVDWVAWRERETAWDAFDLVVIRTPWDYQSDPQRFLATLETIDRSTARLLNPLPLVRWNLDKRYLLKLAEDGAATIPTVCLSSFSASHWPALFDRLQCDRLVLKPLVGANADGVLPLNRDGLPDALEVYEGRACLVQPFVPGVVTEGEYSLIFFDGRFSHCLLKTPAEGDFRVQEEHGASLRSVVPEPRLLEQARALVGLLEPVPLYLRADLVRAPGDQWWLMELELIEPALYLRMDPSAPLRFAQAIDRAGMDMSVPAARETGNSGR